MISSEKLHQIRAHFARLPEFAPALPFLDEHIFRTSATGDLYYDLLRSIIGQQLSGKAAASIHSRFLELFPDGRPLPGAVLRLELPQLRSAGLSRQKAGYIQNVATYFSDRSAQSRNWAALDDEAIVRELTTIKGVGKWTVQMILMFSLGRGDVFPVDDLGIQQGMTQLYGLTETGRALRRRMLELAEVWRPYRTYACRAVWRYKDEAS